MKCKFKHKEVTGYLEIKAKSPSSLFLKEEEMRGLVVQRDNIHPFAFLPYIIPYLEIRHIKEFQESNKAYYSKIVAETIFVPGEGIVTVSPIDLGDGYIKAEPCDFEGDEHIEYKGKVYPVERMPYDNEPAITLEELCLDIDFRRCMKCGKVERKTESFDRIIVGYYCRMCRRNIIFKKLTSHVTVAVPYTKYVRGRALYMDKAWEVYLVKYYGVRHDKALPGLTLIADEKDIKPDWIRLYI